MEENNKSIVDILKSYSIQQTLESQKWALDYFENSKYYIEQYDTEGSVIKISVSRDEFNSECLKRQVMYNTFSVGYGDNFMTLNINK